MKKKIAVFLMTMALCISLFPSTFLASVTVNPVSSAVHPGSKITVAGTSNLNEVIIKVQRPDQSILYFNVSPVVSGVYSDSITLGQNEPIGTYQVLVGQGTDTSTTSLVVTVKPIQGGDVSTPAPTPTKPDEITVDNEKVSNQAYASDTQEVKVEIPVLTNDKPEVSIKLPAISMQVIAESSKPLVIQSGTLQVVIPNEVLKDLVKGSLESSTVTFKIAKTIGVKGSVSATFEFSITSVKDKITTTVSIFSKPVQVTVPLTAVVKDTRKVAAYYVNETTKKLEYVGGKFQNDKLVFKTNHFSKFVVIENDKTFTDVTKHWAQDEIEVLASRMITSGKTDTKFDPQGQITRAEFAVLIARALNLPTNAYKGTFTDVTKSKAWAYAGVEAAYETGIVKGSSKTEFKPDALITREEIATMIVRAVKYQDEQLLTKLDTSKSFADASLIGVFAKETVNQAAALGIVKGREGNKFDPKANATRAESVVMLYRLLTKLDEF